MLAAVIIFYGGAGILSTDGEHQSSCESIISSTFRSYRTELRESPRYSNRVTLRNRIEERKQPYCVPEAGES